MRAKRASLSQSENIYFLFLFKFILFCYFRLYKSLTSLGNGLLVKATEITSPTGTFLQRGFKYVILFW